MTQPLPEVGAQVGVGNQPEPEEGLLLRLIRAEFSPARLARTLDAPSEAVHPRHWQEALAEPLGEALSRDGKCFRSRLVEVAYQLASAGRAPATAMPQALLLLVEVLHAGSLIIDDIEDDSQWRRGKAALHLLVGLPLALNAGNWLYFLPHRLFEELSLDAKLELELRRALDRAALRCHYGQALDLGVRLATLGRGEVFGVVNLSTRLKTGSLLELAAEVGAIAGGADPHLRQALQRFGRAYGVALQMLDDVSGLYQPRRAHKAHEDLIRGRPTWPWAWLAQLSDELVYSRLQQQAQAVERRVLQPEVLVAAMRNQLGDSPKRLVHEGLHDAFRRLERRVSRSALLEPLAEEIARLERAYV